MPLSMIILFFLIKKIEAHNEGCYIYSDDNKIYEYINCKDGYNSVNCPVRDCVICFKCEITYCNECMFKMLRWFLFKK